MPIDLKTITTSSRLITAKTLLEKSSPSYLFIGKTSQWGESHPIILIEKSNPAKIHLVSHGYSTGDSIQVSGVNGMVEMNILPLSTITVIDSKTFTIDGVDSTAYSDYISGGIISKFDDVNVPTPNNSIKDEIFSRNSAISMKRIFGNQMSLVIPRVDWLFETNFLQYDSDDKHNFLETYCMNDSFHVYKCLSNNNGAQSKFSPEGTSLSSEKYNDGYIWKYMLTVDESSQFLTDDWIPIKRLLDDDGSDQWKVQTLNNIGSIESIKINAVGDLYGADINDIDIGVYGDGSGAELSVMDGGLIGEKIYELKIDNPGSDYSYAEIVTTHSTGTGFEALARVSPPSGHGSDPEIELGAFNVMIIATIIGDEDGSAMIDNDYRIKGILHYPEDVDNQEVLNDVYDLRQKLKIDQISGTIQKNSIITGKSTGTTAIVTEVASEYLYVSEVIGDFMVSETIETSSGTGFIEEVNLPEVDIMTGRISLLNFHEPYTRTAEQTDELRYVVKF